MIEEIRSGAQTGADIAGLDAGLALGLRVGGWVPYGKRIDGGTLTNDQMLKYNLKQHPSSAYPPRTEQNVRDTDGTVIFGNPYSPGCALTLKLCRTHKKPFLIMDTIGYDAAGLLTWILNNGIRVMNVAGNRERTNPGIYKLTFETLVEALRS